MDQQVGSYNMPQSDEEFDDYNEEIQDDEGEGDSDYVEGFDKDEEKKGAKYEGRPVNISITQGNEK